MKIRPSFFKNLLPALLLLAFVYITIHLAVLPLKLILQNFPLPKLPALLLQSTYPFLSVFAVLFLSFLFFKKLKLAKSIFPTHPDEKIKDTLGFYGLPTWTDIGLAILGLTATFLISVVLISLLSFILHFDLEQRQELGLPPLTDPVIKLTAFIFVAILTPISEELVFRGWLFAKLRLKYKFIFSAITSSLLFGFLHGQWNVGITTFVMGTVACFLREYTSTIYAPILLHIFKNASAFYLLFLFSAI